MDAADKKNNRSGRTIVLSSVLFSVLAAVLIHLFFAFAFKVKHVDEAVKDVTFSRFSVLTGEGRLDMKNFNFSLTYQDPETFLKGSGRMLVSGTFNSTSDPTSSPAPVLPDSEEKILLNKPAEKLPVPVPEGYDAAKPLDVINVASPVKENVKAVKYPVCTDRDGSVIDVVFDDAVLKSASSESVKSITLLNVSEGIDVDGTKVDTLSVPPETRIIVSCGNPRLDALAKRTVDKAVLNSKVKRGTVRVYWNKSVLFNAVPIGEKSSDDEVKK